MIDRTNLSIEAMADDHRRRGDHRRDFYRMLRSTDRILWLLEELNMDGVGEIPSPARPRIQEELATLPKRARQRFRSSPAVQDALDSVFDVQEELFRWRNPELAFDEEEAAERAG
ncbi:MAG TPA: hypothetical protein VG015_02840 [Candidatus Dormibacteraeota bacterium]|jgi:hypothetical protein|nr:hypothetical protein [Candidatus Dormibacteraeota bacterium]